MGIPHLTRLLLPFAETVTLGRNEDEPPADESRCVLSVVIDGPSLVYHVFSRLLCCMDLNSRTLGAQPTCNQVSIGVMAYLLQLTNLGIQIKKICFDGALPLSKRETRLSRLEKSRRKLEIFCSQSRGSLKLSDDPLDGVTIDPEKVLKSRGSPAKYRDLPDNPFMVPTVFEDLRNRWDKRNIAKEAKQELCSVFANLEDFPWANITLMVPREADIDCACIARLTGSAVLTNDSDLLLHDLGSHGSVVFLDSVEMTHWIPCRPTEAKVRAVRLCPTVLSHRLGILGLQKFAYELKHSPQSSLAELIQRSRTSSDTETALRYRQFLDEYKCASSQHIETSRLPQDLDARLSEIWCHYELRNKLPDGGVPNIYLPILFEDHTRRCAWEDGRCYRILAYSILNLCHPVCGRFSYIKEHVRRGQRIAVDRLLFHDEHRIAADMISLLERLNSLIVSFGDSTALPTFWRLFALIEIYHHASNRARLPTSAQLSKFVRLGYMGVGLDWADVHLAAQIQSVLYSLRILKQLMGVTKFSGHIVNKVKDILESLPPLYVLMGSTPERTLEISDITSVNKLMDIFQRGLESNPKTGDSYRPEEIQHHTSHIDEPIDAAPHCTHRTHAKRKDPNPYSLLAVD